MNSQPNDELLSQIDQSLNNVIESQALRAASGEVVSRELFQVYLDRKVEEKYSTSVQQWKEVAEKALVQSREIVKERDEAQSALSLLRAEVSFQKMKHEADLTLLKMQSQMQSQNVTMDIVGTAVDRAVAQTGGVTTGSQGPTLGQAVVREIVKLTGMYVGQKVLGVQGYAPGAMDNIR